MNSLAQGLKTLLEQHFLEARKHDSEAVVRPILVGPPAETLDALFELLSSGGIADWQIAGSSQQLNVTVLLISSALVGSSTTANGNSLTGRCQWDYAVTVRNSRSLVLMLASPAAWDNRPESLSNTTETLGSPTTGRGGFRDNTWRHLIRQLSVLKSLDEAVIRSTLQETARQGQALDLSVRDRVPWILMDALLGATPAGLTSANILSAAAGFASNGSTGVSVKESANAVKALASFMGKYGVAEGIDKLKGTDISQTRGLESDLDALAAHLSASILSATDFENSPAWHYRPSDPIPAWWYRLDVPTLQSLLEEADDRPRVRLTLTCENALNAADKLPGEPFVVTQAVHLRASAAETAILTGASFSRKIQRSPSVNLPATPTDPYTCIDAAPIQHLKPLKYMVTAPNANAGTLDVLALDMFGCGGMLHIRDAAKNPPPSFDKASKIWSQQIGLRRGGLFEGRVYHRTAAAMVAIQQEGEQAREQPTIAGSSFVTFTLDLEDNAAVQISLNDTQGNNIGTWSASFNVQEISDVARSRFEALIQEHRTGRKTIPRPEDTPVQRTEGTSYLTITDSWKPVLACWSSEELQWLDIDWSVARAGDVTPQIDPRPSLSPPTDVLSTRENVRQHLAAKQQAISEIEFNNPATVSLVEKYLTAYITWLTQAPNHATWLDAIAIHSAAWNVQAGHHVPSDEPVVILLSPLHPLRLGWHCIAQQQLVEGLLHKCPAAGLLDPSGAPDAGAWSFNTGQGTIPRAFLSLPCKNPHWTVLINHLFLNQDKERLAVLRQISSLGLDVQGVTGGFTVPQAIDSLQEVARLLPARATLRVGLVGTPESSAACADGVIEWCKGAHEEGATEAGPYNVDVFDTREAPDPSPEQLASLSETTEEHVKWFKLAQNAAPPRLDLTIIDQLGTYSPTTASGDARSAVGQGALYRVRVRQDFQNAKTLSESRIGRQIQTPTTFVERVREAIQKFEALALNDNASSQFRFRPNQDAIGNRLSNSTFLAVTSSQIDPACIVRGVSGQSGYLWDYELPGMLGGPDSNVGYYLLAKPLEAMRAAIKRSAALILSPPPDPVGILDEISRHGIPILKRLASGGTQSRGELGLLLAVRLLQDVFRGNAAAARLPVWKDRCIHMVLPVDPYEEPFERIRRELCKSTTTAQRPDLLVIAIYLPANGVASLKITPVEVKFREGNLPAVDARAALRQAENLGKIATAVWNQPPVNDLWATCGRALLAQAMDFAFRIYADPFIHGHTSEEWTRVHEDVLQQVLDGTTALTITLAGRLLAFDNSATSAVLDLDGDQFNDTAILSPDDARVLLSGTGVLSPQADSAAKLLDFSFPWCAEDEPGLEKKASEKVQKNQQVSVSNAPSVAEPEVSPPATSDAVPFANDTSKPGTVQRSVVIPPATRQRVRDAFSGFIGNEPAVARLSNDLLRALIESPPQLSKNYLFTGLPSTGKTELSRRIATALGLPFVKLDGRGVISRERLFELVNGELNQQNMAPSQIGQQVGLPVMEYPPLIVFIDEVHLVPRGLQEGLLTMLEAADRTVVLAKQVAHVEKATFLFATTRASDVDPAFVSRCDEIQLREYSQEEVADILTHKVPHEWPREVYFQLARLGRCVPRVAMQLANGLETAVLVAEHPKELSAHLDDVRRAREIDENGLTPMDLAYLELLERSNRPVGEQVVVNMLRTVDKDRILNEIEPFLARLGFIKHGAQGREITGPGKEYVLEKRRTGKR
jgi:Holliday junction resolvasome RuvABC ATP-dependent DNA helicase subunit